MGKSSNIQWTDATWNIARGCSKVDADCKYCYMFRDSMNNTRYTANEVVRTKTVFDMPKKLKEPSKIFTCSLTDFFHEGCDSFRNEAWDIIRECPQHTFQILTKRPERIMQCLPEYWDEIKDRVWMGTSIGSQDSIHRMVTLAELDLGCIRFLSLEPLHGEILLQQPQIQLGRYKVYAMVMYNWVIVGGESGNETGKYRYRPCELKWIENIVFDCTAFKVPVFVKQMGTHLAKQMGLKDRHGGDIDEFPEHLRVRQFPE